LKEIHISLSDVIDKVSFPSNFSENAKTTLLSSSHDFLSLSNISLTQFSQIHSTQMSSDILTTTQNYDQIKSAASFTFPYDQKKQVEGWKSIKIICENF
jgi:hypothetical protein